MRLAGALALAAALAAPAWADPVTLQPDVMHRRPVVVAVDTQNVTTVQFCSPLSWVAFKAPWLHATISPQDKRVLLLDVTAMSGDTTMMVWTEGDGRPLQLRITVSPRELANHLYFVACAPSAPQTAAQAPSPPGAPPQGQAQQPQPSPPQAPQQPAPHRAPATAQQWDAFAKGLTARQWTLLTAFLRSPTASTRAAFEASLTPDQKLRWAPLVAGLTVGGAPSTTSQLPAAPAGPRILPVPSWLSWQAQVSTAPGGALVSYTVQNTGEVTVVLDRARLRVTTQDGTTVADVAVTRQDTSGYEGRLPPGAVESGVIRIPPGRGTVTIQWPAVAVDDHGTTYMIAQTVP